MIDFVVFIRARKTLQLRLLAHYLLVWQRPVYVDKESLGFLNLVEPKTYHSLIALLSIRSALNDVTAKATNADDFVAESLRPQLNSKI